ncbi:COP9 signalosome complex subunit 7a [Verticillium alfalfae VaMs.102]|uniref:COP9 signalosome complex subunit 7a n=1 Tax=Verticillium alfalfae (strain VaMs.102 / ATCC MYA-4576 / FGSC 10136) TaxID=526221 RepID=C9SH43_VERA1|nr:COP9 signalosome complex subunit 7a [Verticillium alfalfae VaMs.102]EEY17637.1 COP9 signalosome complex subunit 7a [Verticillium alfalfae VaMs.102]
MEQTKALNALEVTPFHTPTSSRHLANLLCIAFPGPQQVSELPSCCSRSCHPRDLQSEYISLHRAASDATDPESRPICRTRRIPHLSLLTLARDRTNLAYPRLQTALSLPDTRALEALVTSAIYAGLIQATLDPARQHVHVTALAPLRDLAPDSIPALSDNQRSWSDRCTATLRDIDAQTAALRAEAARRQRHAGVREEQLAELVAETKHSGGGAGWRPPSAAVTDAAPPRGKQHAEGRKGAQPSVGAT